MTDTGSTVPAPVEGIEEDALAALAVRALDMRDAAYRAQLEALDERDGARAEARKLRQRVDELESNERRAQAYLAEIRRLRARMASLGISPEEEEEGRDG